MALQNPKIEIVIAGRPFEVEFNNGTIEDIETVCDKSAFQLFAEIIQLVRAKGGDVTGLVSVRTARRFVAGAIGLSLDPADKNTFVDAIVPAGELMTTFGKLAGPFCDAVAVIMKPITEKGSESAEAEKKAEAGAESHPPSSAGTESGPASSS